tara:strand:- start:1820 stop:1978 length:159 start_codon:yes stop_codon:yes gene_type:complete
LIADESGILACSVRLETLKYSIKTTNANIFNVDGKFFENTNLVSTSKEVALA